MFIRDAGTDDLDTTWDIYRDAVLNGTAPFYTLEQAQAWVGSDEACPAWWSDRMAAATTWLCADEAGDCGFLSLAPPRHLDFFFVRPRSRGTGAAQLLYSTFITALQDAGETTATTFSSHLARRFLEPKGWEVTETETAMRNGVELTRFAMRLSRLPKAV